MQNVPRWDEHAPKYVDDAAIHSYRCGKLGVLVGILEECKFGNTVDKEKIVARALLHDMNETKTGSIKYFTKKNPLVKDVIKRIEKEASEEIVAHLSKSLRPYFYDAIVKAEDESEVEGRLVIEIDTLDALLYCKREKENESSLFFAEKYIELYERLRMSEFESIRYLVKIIHSSGIVEGEEAAYWNILDNMMEMDKIRRWKGKMNLMPDNDASHTFRMTVIALFNALVEKEKYGIENVNTYEILGKCLFHDLIESITGDVLGPIKHSSEETKEAFESFEKMIGEQMLEGFGEKEKEYMRSFLVEAKSDDFNGMLVDVADKLDAMVKARLEMKMNPSVYAKSFSRQLRTLQVRFENKSTVFFLAYILHDIYLLE